MLHLVIGPMFSQKTLYAIRLVKRYQAIGKKVLVIDHVKDDRYSADLTAIVSHDGDSAPAIFLNNLTEMLQLDSYKAADVVIIEEGQFFSDLHEVISKEADTFPQKIFIVCGLSGDYQRKPIGQICDLIPFAENVTKLNGFCSSCKTGQLGSFTHRKTVSKEQVMVGGADMYSCLCRECYLKESA